jgi:tRNA U34 5-methylaminomethyl-2-thiouridine-forming methyltransferase MnmC
MNKSEIVKTGDGSDTLFVSALGEHYHSTFGAVQESMHIFIEAGLKKIDKKELTLFEVGFGTGLNAFLTLFETVKTNQIIHYITTEKYPVPSSLWSMLNFPMFVPPEYREFFSKIHEAPWNREVNLTEHFTLLKISSGLADVDYTTLPPFDLVYFDAFSPEKQPELWETPVFFKIANHCAPNGKLVTYCAKGVVRRSLNTAGFATERIPGPPGKREMLRGTKITAS